MHFILIQTLPHLLYDGLVRLLQAVGCFSLQSMAQVRCWIHASGQSHLLWCQCEQLLGRQLEATIY